jgi:hypothetical protein
VGHAGSVTIPSLPWLVAVVLGTPLAICSTYRHPRAHRRPPSGGRGPQVRTGLIQVARNPRGSIRADGYAALRRRLRITTGHGTDLFVVNHVSQVVARIDQVRGS